MESRVADFDPPAHHHPAPAYSAPPAPTHPSLHNYGHYAFPPPTAMPAGVKAEPTEYQYGGGYGLAPPRPPPGYTTNSGGSGGRIPQLDGPSGSSVVKGKAAERLRGGAGVIPQLDGSSSGSSASPPPPTLHSAHPSLAAAAPAANNGAVDDEAINSDLDDSDTDGNDDEDDGGVTGDIMFCTYDKVARVKNKWKCVLKDGMVSIDGRDYLFSKCNGEFEW
ncbi:TFIIA-domain-containing protein [Peniophora sp. CONT]|nr:TFIIA-domain-containing protein [Peniophora sp. CONT]